MIRPRLPKIASGTRLTTNLVNDIINRTEYAADLLRQYKLTAGNGMYVEPHYDGTRVSYLQPVAGGATPAQPISPAYRIVGLATVGGIIRGWVYDGTTFTDIIYPGSNTNLGSSAQGIDGLNIIGYANNGFISYLYNGSTFTSIPIGSASNFVTYGIDGETIVGSRITGGVQRGFIYNGSTFTDVVYPGASQTAFYDIDGSNIVGYATAGTSRRGFIYNGSTFTDIIYPGFIYTFILGIYKNTVVGYADFDGTVNTFYVGFTYTNSTFTTFSVPGSLRTVPYGIKGSNIVGWTFIEGTLRGFLYNGSTFTDIMYPGATSTIAYGIG
jgi:hypothetical protein